MTYLSKSDKVCFNCKIKVGEMDEYTGIAKYSTNWKAYIYFFLAVLILTLFVRWAFLNTNDTSFSTLVDNLTSRWFKSAE